ncbi:MAG TPA: efflux RND transporter periplasmic adaptor subunit [Polyangiaceae bacterium]
MNAVAVRLVSTSVSAVRARAFLSVLALAVALAPLLAACEEAKKPPPPPPPTVYVTTVARSDLPIYIESVAALDGFVNAEIRARVRGYLKTQDYKDGAFVKSGTQLFTIEATDYTAAVQEARAALTRARVLQGRNKTQGERYQGLFKTGMVSQQDVDNVTASVGDADGQVQAAEAQLSQAALNLSYTTMRSPIDGVAGIALVRVGNLVGQSDPTLLTTVSQIDPIRVNFPISETDYVKNPDRFKKLDTRDLAWARKQFVRLDAGQDTEAGDPGIDLVLTDGNPYPHRGVIVSANRQIDSSTGTITLQALVPNPDGLLRPGQFGRVRIKRDNAGHDVIAIPEKALISVQGQYSVGVVGPDNKVALHPVVTGASVNGFRVIDKGLAEGDRLVVDGVQKISDGAVVDPRPVPDASAAGSGAPAPGASAASAAGVKN